MTGYAFYVNTYHGVDIPEEEWEHHARRAEEQLARYKRIYQVSAPCPGAEDMAVCAMAEALYAFELLASYGSTADQSLDLSPRGQEKELYRCASRYLDIYRGAG